MDPVGVGWCPLGIQSLGLLGNPFELVNHGFGVGSSRGRVVSLRNSISRTLWQSFWGAKRVARRESLAEKGLNLFEKTRTASVLPVVITSHLTVRRSWKLMRSASGLLDLLLALGVGSCMVRVVSLSN